ncbi:MAG TPA: UDP-N-acetylglucosamine--N-acetylmuramyl-(pentapeptide) pyrophosphoryl-undecaprenol N-acetylglucosamine transferase, partial [Bryobacteraceae bacterium]
RWFPPGRTEVTGMPVRAEFFAIPPKPLDRPLTVLITGGSQGSRTLNRAAQQSWPLWEKDAVKLLHQTGSGAYDQLAPEFQSSEIAGEISPFLLDMPASFAAADLVVSRAGMGTLSELAAAGKPSILVPLPTAADQHQLRNAEAMEKLGAARMILDAEFDGRRLRDEVLRLAAEPGLLDRMGRAARSFAKPDAARRAAEVLESFA